MHGVRDGVDVAFGLKGLLNIFSVRDSNLVGDVTFAPNNHDWQAPQRRHP